jgi:hypothetical protein
MVASLKEVEALVDSLAKADQVRLLQYLLPRVADVVGGSATAGSGGEDAWLEFRRVGERLAATENGESITQSITDMRR